MYESGENKCWNGKRKKKQYHRSGSAKKTGERRQREKENESEDDGKNENESERE